MFDEIYKLSCRIANALIKAGYEKETKGAVWSTNHPIAWTCTLSIWRAGMAWVPVNPMNPPDENASLLDRFDTEVVFFKEVFADKVAAVKDKLPKVKNWICIDGPSEGADSLDEFTQT